MIVYLADGEATIDFDALTLTLNGQTRPLTDEEIIEFQGFAEAARPVQDQALAAHLGRALDLLRDAISDNAVDDAEVAAATPVVLAAMERYSELGVWDEETTKQAIQIVSRIAHALLIRGGQAQAVIAQLGGTVAALNDSVTDLTNRITALESAE